MSVKDALPWFEQLVAKIFTADDMLVLEESLSEEEKCQKLRFRCPVCSTGFVSFVSFREHAFAEHDHPDWRAYNNPWIDQKTATYDPDTADLSQALSLASFLEDSHPESQQSPPQSIWNSLSYSSCCAKKLKPADLLQNLPYTSTVTDESKGITQRVLGDSPHHLGSDENIPPASSSLPEVSGSMGVVAEAKFSTYFAQKDTEPSSKTEPASTTAGSESTSQLDFVNGYSTCCEVSDSVSAPSGEPLSSLMKNLSVRSDATENGESLEGEGLDLQMEKILADHIAGTDKLAEFGSETDELPERDRDGSEVDKPQAEELSTEMNKLRTDRVEMSEPTKLSVSDSALDELLQGNSTNVDGIDDMEMGESSQIDSSEKAKTGGDATEKIDRKLLEEDCAQTVDPHQRFCTETGVPSGKDGTRMSGCPGEDPTLEISEDQVTYKPYKRESMDVESEPEAISLTSSLSSSASSDSGIGTNKAANSQTAATTNSNTITSISESEPMINHEFHSDSKSKSPTFDKVLDNKVKGSQPGSSVIHNEEASSIKQSPSSVSVTHNEDSCVSQSPSSAAINKESYPTTKYQHKSTQTDPPATSRTTKHRKSVNCDSFACPITTKKIPEEDFQFMLEHMGHHMRLFSEDETLRLWNDKRGNGLELTKIAKSLCENPNLLKELTVWFFQDPTADYDKLKPLFDKLGNFASRSCKLVHRGSCSGFFMGKRVLKMHKYRQEVNKELEGISENDNEILFCMAHVLLHAAKQAAHVYESIPLKYFTKMCIVEPEESSFAAKYPLVTQSLFQRSSGAPSDKFYGLVRMLEMAMRKHVDIRDFRASFLGQAHMLTEEVFHERSLRKYVENEMKISFEQSWLLELFTSQFLGLRWVCGDIFD